MTAVPSPDRFLTALNLEQRGILSLSWRFVAAYIAATAIPNIGLDWYLYDATTLYFWAAFWSWAAGYLLLTVLLQRANLLPAGARGGVGTYFALGIVTGIPIALALMVLVLPGLYLMMRWLPVFARALTAPDWIGNSLRWSWRVTERVQRPLSVALLGPVLCYGTALGLSYYFDYTNLSYELTTLLMDVAVAIASAWLTVLGVAAFALLSKTAEDRQFAGSPETA